MKRHKYGAIPTVTSDGIRHPSKKQAKRWEELKLLERAGDITNLRREVPYRLEVGGHLVATYRADHVYEWSYGRKSEVVVEDSKGMETPLFKMKKKLMWAIHGIEVKVV